jgi:catechol 2,3-dioxygenase-like lactoylglutathione lyase family enzyme
MFDHIQLKVKDLKSSKHFYTAALTPLGFTLEYEDDGMIGFGPKGAPALWLGQGESRGPVHIAFAAKDRAAMKGFYSAALPAGGQDN